MAVIICGYSGWGAVDGTMIVRALEVSYGYIWHGYSCGGILCLCGGLTVMMAKLYYD